MKIGMLWYDNDPKKTLEAKIQGAVEYYAKKYGKTPNLCYVHPLMLVNGTVTSNGIEIRARNPIQVASM